MCIRNKFHLLLFVNIPIKTHLRLVSHKYRVFKFLFVCFVRIMGRGVAKILSVVLILAVTLVAGFIFTIFLLGVLIVLLPSQ